MTKPPADPPVDVRLLRVEPTVKGLLRVVVVVAATWVTLRLVPVVLSVVVALFLVGTLDPAITWLERKGWRRGRAIGVVFGALVVVALLVLGLTIPSLVAQVVTLVEHEPALRGRLAEFCARYPITAPLAQSLRELHYDALARTAAGEAFEYSSRLVESVAYLASAVFLALYVMIDRDRLRGALFAAVPRTHHIRLSRVLLNLETIVGGYIRGQFLTSVLMGIFTFILLTACGAPNALSVAVFAGLADVLPYVGAILSIAPALAAAATKGPGVVVVVLVAMLAYEELESRVLVPKIYGNALRLPSSIVLVALLVGGTLMGIVGALLALPAAAAIRMLIEELRVELPGEQVDDSAVREKDERAEREYERRADGVPAEQAAAIAVEISEGRQLEEGGGAEAAEVPITGGKRG